MAIQQIRHLDGPLDTFKWLDMNRARIRYGAEKPHLFVKLGNWICTFDGTAVASRNPLWAFNELVCARLSQQASLPGRRE